MLKRISRRRFNHEYLSDKEIEKINEMLVEINAESGLNATFLEDGHRAFYYFLKSYALFENVRSMILMKGKIFLPDIKEKVGYYGEGLVLDLVDMGLGTCWVGGTFNRAVISLPGDEELVCVIVVGKTDEIENKEKIIRSAITRSRKSIHKRIDSTCSIPNWAILGMKSVLHAPSARNSQKARFHYDGNVVTASIANNSNLDLVDLGIAKKHFEIGTPGKFDFGNGAEFHRYEKAQ